MHALVSCAGLAGFVEAESNERMARFHLGEAFRKLEVHSQVELVRRVFLLLGGLQ